MDLPPKQAKAPVESVARQLDLVGQQVSLRPVTPDDYGYLYYLAMDPSVSFRWRLRNTTPSFDVFKQSLHQNVLCQYMVTDTHSGQPDGFITLYNVDFRNGIGYLAYVIDPRVQGTPAAFHGLVLFLGSVFRAWDLHKIYAETTDLSWPSFSSGGGRYFEVEGTYPDHEWYDGQLWTMYVLAFYRSKWIPLLERWMPLVAPERP